jgi:superfamily II DNA or RNA helicase
MTNSRRIGTNGRFSHQLGESAGREPSQQAAGAAMLAHDTGVLAATTAFGKTVLAAWLIASAE